MSLVCLFLVQSADSLVGVMQSRCMHVQEILDRGGQFLLLEDAVENCKSN